MADWGDLHEDLLVLIMKKINLIEDFVAFGSVCRSWNRAAFTNRQCLQPQIPWLMLAEEEEPSEGDNERLYRRPIYSVAKDAIISNNLCIPPEMRDRRCIGLNYGWVLAISRREELNLVNPLSGTVIELPCQNLIPDYNRDSYSHLYIFIRKAALSGNPSTSSDFELMVGHWCGLCYWRSGEKSWTKVRSGCVGDVVYYNNQFYALFFPYNIWECNISEPVVALRHIAAISRLERIGFEPYIVGSEADVLLVLVRITEEPDTEDPDFNEHPQCDWVEREYETESIYIDASYELECFMVFEVDLHKGNWKEISNLGDASVFVGYNTPALFNHVTEYSHGTIQPNRVYFTDDNECMWFLRAAHGGGKDMGCYNLANGEIEKFNLGDSFSRISPPFWFIPSL